MYDIKLKSKEEIEKELPKSFFILHELISKILKDNDIAPHDEE